MKVIKDLTNINYNKGYNKKNEYIVIHYTANVKDTALGNCKYFKDVDRSASAHYFVDENEIRQCVEDYDIAWHCGAKQYFNECRNTNSIGIEMCNSVTYNEIVEGKTIELVKELMDKYKIPVENVIRHYDVTHKICPKVYVEDESKWNEFKSKFVKVDSELLELRQQVKDKFGFDEDVTMKFLDKHPYPKDLYKKILRG